MRAAFIRIALWIVLLVSAMLLPFLPGRYDPLAFSLSVSAIVVVFGGLLLVPIGVVADLQPRIRAGEDGVGRGDARRGWRRCRDVGER